MVTVAKDHTTENTSGVPEGPAGRMAAKLAGGLVLWLRNLYTRHELMRLSDRALEDIGTTRADLPAFAKQSDPWRRLPKDAAFVLALGALIERVQTWRVHRRKQAQIYRELMDCSDRELNELGLSRRDIPQVARMG
jgi:uncharacterized protein YjiS (DUF1127 family)